MFGSLAIAEPHVSRPVNDPVTAVAVGGCAATALPLDATCAAFARRLFRQAAEVFLFPSPQMGSLDAKVVDMGGRRAVAIGAQVRGDAAAGLSPFQIAFTLGI